MKIRVFLSPVIQFLYRSRYICCAATGYNSAPSAPLPILLWGTSLCCTSTSIERYKSSKHSIAEVHCGIKRPRCSRSIAVLMAAQDTHALQNLTRHSGRLLLLWSSGLDAVAGDILVLRALLLRALPCGKTSSSFETCMLHTAAHTNKTKPTTHQNITRHIASYTEKAASDTPQIAGRPMAIQLPTHSRQLTAVLWCTLSLENRVGGCSKLL